MLATLVILAGVGLLAGAGWFTVRTGRAWLDVIEQCRETLGGELTPGNLLLPPRLWRRTDDGLSLVIGLRTSGEGGRRMATRVVGGARSMLASTRLSIDGDGLPGDLRIHPAAARAPFDARRVTTGIPDFDRRVHLAGSLSSALSRLGGERRAAIAAAVGQGASFSHGVWAIERAEPVTRASELVGLARLLIAAAHATRAGETIAEERLYDAVRRDPEPGFRLACLECLVLRSGVWRVRAIEAGLADPDPAVRLRAGQADGVAGREVLIALASGGPEDIRVASIQTLANDDGPDIRAVFERLAASGSGRIRAAALRGMARLGHVPTALLLRFARHPDPALRVLALMGLRPAGAVAAAQAELALNDPAPDVVLAAVEMLGARGNVSVVPALRRLKIGPLDSKLKAAVERAIVAVLARRPPDAMGGLALAGPDQPEAGRLGLDEGRRGRLSDHAHPSIDPGVADLFADEPADLFAEQAPRAARAEVSPDTESE